MNERTKRNEWRKKNEKTKKQQQHHTKTNDDEEEKKPYPEQSNSICTQRAKLMPCILFGMYEPFLINVVLYNSGHTYIIHACCECESFSLLDGIRVFCMPYTAYCCCCCCPCVVFFLFVFCMLQHRVQASKGKGEAKAILYTVHTAERSLLYSFIFSAVRYIPNIFRVGCVLLGPHSPLIAIACVFVAHTI